MKRWLFALPVMAVSIGLGYTAIAQTSTEKANRNSSGIESSVKIKPKHGTPGKAVVRAASSERVLRLGMPTRVSLSGSSVPPPRVTKTKMYSAHSSLMIGHAGFGRLTINLDDYRLMDESVELAKQGDRSARQGNWPQAENAYKASLQIWPIYPDALYGMGDCAEHRGNLPLAIQYYRTEIYSHDHTYGTVPGDGYATNDAVKLMEYVLLLSQNGQTAEALAVYHRTLSVFNYRDGKQCVDALLPDFGEIKSAYMLHQMQAMAHLAIAVSVEGNDNTMTEMHLQRALMLAPDSPLPYFYHGEYLQGYRGNPQAALADYARARQLGEDQVDAGIDKMMRILPDYLKTANGISLDNEVTR